MVTVSRRSFLVSTLSLVIVLAATASGFARPISGVVAFGDSLSDNGNFSALTGGVYPKSPYYQGRLSNGRVWVEQFSDALGVPLDDKAVAGALTDTQNTASGLVPTATGMQTQVASYLTANPSVNANNLYVVWGGANDIFQYAQGLSSTTPIQSAQNIANEITSLAGAGATQFLIPNLPNLGNTPGGAANGVVVAGILNQYTSAFNTTLSSLLGQLSQGNPGLSIKTLDINSIFTEVLASPGTYGFTNVTDAYIDNQGGAAGVNPKISTAGTLAGSPSGFLFWDDIHPTVGMHTLVGQRAAVAVVPESSTAGLLTAGAGFAGIIGTVTVRRRRK